MHVLQNARQFRFFLRASKKQLVKNLRNTFAKWREKFLDIRVESKDNFLGYKLNLIFYLKDWSAEQKARH